MEISNIMWFGIVLFLFGSVLLAWRLYHRVVLEEFWNNLPATGLLSWGITIGMVGAAIMLALIVFLGEPCPDSCARSGDSYVGGLWVSAIICVVVGVSLSFCKCCRSADEDSLRYDWGDDKIGKPAWDERRSMSGVDIVLFLMGLAIIVTNARLGTCPVSCGEAVIATPAPIAK